MNGLPYLFVGQWYSVRLIRLLFWTSEIQFVHASRGRYDLKTLRSKRFPMQRSELNFTGNLRPNAMIYRQINKFKIIIKIIFFKKLCRPYASVNARSFRCAIIPASSSPRFVSFSPFARIFLTLEMRHMPRRWKYDTVNELKSLSFVQQLCLIITNDISR